MTYKLSTLSIDSWLNYLRWISFCRNRPWIRGCIRNNLKAPYSNSICDYLNRKEPWKYSFKNISSQVLIHTNIQIQIIDIFDIKTCIIHVCRWLGNKSSILLAVLSCSTSCHSPSFFFIKLPSYRRQVHRRIIRSLKKSI